MPPPFIRKPGYSRMSDNYDDIDFSQILKMLAASSRGNTEGPAEEPIAPLTSQQPAKDPPARPKRCQMDQCKAKLLLTDTNCKCSGFYCMQHRHAELHKCTFDFRATGASDLGKRLVAVTGAKLEKF
jgi:hypothetical protein